MKDLLKMSLVILESNNDEEFHTGKSVFKILTQSFKQLILIVNAVDHLMVKLTTINGEVGVILCKK